jgi:hypothetical protein
VRRRPSLSSWTSDLSPRDLTVTLTERERRILGRSLEFVEAFAPGMRFPTEEHEALRARIMDGLEP